MSHLFGKAAAVEGWTELCLCLRGGPEMREAEEDGDRRKNGPGYVTPPICISLIAYKYLGTTAIKGMVKRELDV